VILVSSYIGIVGSYPSRGLVYVRFSMDCSYPAHRNFVIGRSSIQGILPHV